MTQVSKDHICSPFLMAPHPEMSGLSFCGFIFCFFSPLLASASSESSPFPQQYTSLWAKSTSLDSGRNFVLLHDHLFYPFLLFCLPKSVHVRGLFDELCLQSYVQTLSFFYRAESLICSRNISTVAQDLSIFYWAMILI